MSLSDCPKCWDTPCTCGWQYRDYRESALVDLIEGTLKYKDKMEKLRILMKVLNKIKDE